MKRSTSFILLLYTVLFYPALGLAAINPEETGLRDVEGPVFFPGNYLLLIILTFLVMAGCVLAFLYFRKKKPKEEVHEPVDTRTPWEIAYAQFDELERSPLLQEGQYKAYYSQLSGIVRQYFENQFSVKAPEMTTEEFLWSIEKSQNLTNIQKNALKQFLDSCDIVKFAKYVPGLEEGKESFRLARNLVEGIKSTVTDQTNETNT